jgi:two-component system chemotaxis sensor kinase CheA
VHREIHTLKGESKMLGFPDVNLVCHKLEDLFELARGRGYAIDEDFDLTVNMALRFMAMLVRKKVGARLGGIDLPGFVSQIDTILAEASPLPRTRTGSQQPIRTVQIPRVAPAVRERLGPITIDAFVEYAVARGRRRDRLRGSWHALRELLGVRRAVIGAAQLAIHDTNARALARELGKEVDVSLRVESIEASAELLAAIDTSVLHLVRNALDHGIETPQRRVAVGKPPRGSIRVECRIDGERVILVVSDDGAGVDLDAVRAKALELHLVEPGDDLAARWVDLICHPGFTTRAGASEVSGRGVGLDAVRAGLNEVGGTLEAETVRGRGTTWRASMPLPRISVDAHVARAPGLPFPIAIDRAWHHVDAPSSPVPTVDLAHQLGLTDEPSPIQPLYFANGSRELGIVLDRPPHIAMVRRLVMLSAPATCDVVLVDAAEGLLVHLDRLL